MSDKIARLEAENTAQQVVTECGFTKFPICPFEIAKRHDIDVEPKQSSKPGVSGFLMRVGDVFGIKYALHIQNEGFIRFTVAHELGHYFLPGHPQKLFPSGRGLHESKSGFISHDPMERQADEFASALLMPTHQFREAVDWAGSGFAAIEKLATECKTSITATAIRFTTFTDDAVAVIVSCNDRIDYCFMSDRIRDLRGLTWIKKGDLLPRGATSRFNRDADNVEKARRQESTCGLDDWFDGAPDVEVNEDVVGLGSYGKTLTVLHTDILDDEDDENDDE
ncbi:MAG TPA: ImmA/IrrE family metallo-endopeptidase [Gemmataceae bacterium]|nr:ImmA/IrrE family metallo-endopeptidase [Gemmataceae bacterium]